MKYAHFLMNLFCSRSGASGKGNILLYFGKYISLYSYKLSAVQCDFYGTVITRNEPKKAQDTESVLLSLGLRKEKPFKCPTRRQAR